MKRLVAGIILALIGCATIAAQFTHSGSDRLANAAFAVILELIPGALLIGFGVRAIKRSTRRGTAPDLQASDFPIGEPGAFHRWKNALLEPVNPNYPAGQAHGRYLRWMAILLILAGASGALSVLGTGEAVYILNNRFRLEASVACIVAGVLGLFGGFFQRQISLRPAVVGGLVAGILGSLSLVFIDGWPFLLLLPLGGLAASRSLVKRSPVLVTPRQGAMVGSLSGFVASVTVLLIGVPAAMVTMQIIENNHLETAATYLRDVPGALEPLNMAAAVPVGWLLVTILSIGLGWLSGMIGVALLQKQKGEASHGN